MSDVQPPTSPGMPLPVGFRGRFFRNVIWNTLSNLSGKLIGPVFHLLIARLLVPEDYGSYAIAVAWVAVFEIFKDCGLTQAVVVYRGGSNETSLQFTVQLGVAALFFALTVATANPMAAYFELPELGRLLPLVALVAFIDAAADPLLTRNLIDQNYRRLAVRQALTPLAAGVTGVILAAQGYGVYALAIGYLTGRLAGMLSLAAGSGSIAKIRFDWRMLGELMRTGKHIVAQRFFGFLVNQADSFIVGRALGSQSLGLYRMGNLVAFLAPSASASQVQQVVFTDVSANRDAENVRRRYNQFIFIFGPALLLYSIAFYLVAPFMTPIVLGNQWIDAVPMMQLFAAGVVTGFLTPLNMDIAKVLGFAGAYSYYAAFRSVGTVVALFLASRYSTMHVAATWVAVGFVSTLINDAIFHRRQNFVPLTRGKVAIIAASWAWGALVIFRTMR